MKYKLIFLDTETTGLEKEDRIVQLAYLHDGVWVDEMYKAELPIKIEAMAVTHITDKMVEDKPVFVNSKIYCELKEMFQNTNAIVIAHNSPFDVGMLEREGLSVPNQIDTRKIAMALDEEAKIPSYRLQYLRYYLDLDSEISEPIQAHDAKGDVIVLEILFNRLFEKIKSEGLTDEETIAKMIDITSTPATIRRFPFGKFRGELVADVSKKDKGYLQWLLKEKKKTPDGDEDWIYTLENLLK